MKNFENGQYWVTKSEGILKIVNVGTYSMECCLLNGDLRLYYCPDGRLNVKDTPEYTIVKQVSKDDYPEYFL